MKKSIFFLFVFVQLSLFGQENKVHNKNSFCIDVDRTFNTCGDYWTYHYKNEYRYRAFKHFGIGIGLGFIHATTESSIYHVPENMPTNIRSGDERGGLIVLDLNPVQYTQTHSDLTLFYQLNFLKRFEFSIAAGASLAYISFTYFTNTQTGYYINFWEEGSDFYMVSPYYTRIIDLGLCAKLSLVYNLSERFFAGATCGFNTYEDSGYRTYDFGITAGIRF